MVFLSRGAYPDSTLWYTSSEMGTIAQCQWYGKEGNVRRQALRSRHLDVKSPTGLGEQWLKMLLGREASRGILRIRKSHNPLKRAKGRPRALVACKP